MLKFGDLINRLRHNRGFGVQSPSAFYFVTQVLKEKLPYYAYNEVDAAAKKHGTKKKKYYRRLFRVANYLKPQSIIIVGKESHAARTALAAARQSAILASFDDAKEAFLRAITSGTLPSPLLVYIGECDNYAQACDTAIKKADNNSAIIVEGIHQTAQKAQWWAEVIKSPHCVVTYDLYSAGILLFDKEKPKQHYTLKM
jgi:hypothetical protein